MNPRPGGSEGPEDVDAAFAEIVADLEREGLGSGLTGERPTAAPEAPGPPVTKRPEDTDPNTGPPPAPGPTPDAAAEPNWHGSDVEWDWSGGDESEPEEEHYVPPEPPPLPKLRPGTIFGMLLIVIGIFLLVAPAIIGLGARIATPLALISLAAGIGWLVLRMRQGPPPDSGWDDGAQL